MKIHTPLSCLTKVRGSLEVHSLTGLASRAPHSGKGRPPQLRRSGLKSRSLPVRLIRNGKLFKIADWEKVKSKAQAKEQLAVNY